MAQEYVRRVDHYTDDVFDATKPPNTWPVGIDACDKGDGSPHLHYTDVIVVPIKTTDHLVTNTATGARQVVTAADFAAQYVIATGPG